MGGFVNVETQQLWDWSESQYSICELDLYQVKVLKCRVSAFPVCQEAEIQPSNDCLSFDMFYINRKIFGCSWTLVSCAWQEPPLRTRTLPYFILFLSLMAFTLCMFKKKKKILPPSSHLVSWCRWLVVLTLSFSFIIPQLKQFLDTEVLFHNKIK